jgi:hypothetical protein
VTGIVLDGAHARIEGREVFTANDLAKKIIARGRKPGRLFQIDKDTGQFYLPFTFSGDSL